MKTDSTKLKNIAVLVSGGGTNLQALINAKNKGEIPGAKLKLVISSKTGVKALERASRAGIENIAVERKSFASPEAFEAALLKELKSHNIHYIVLAGFLSILSPAFINAYKDRIINIHPSLIPSFSGDGFYGLKVHEAALERGVKISGATVHFVNEVTDGGKILLQKAVEVKKGDTPESLQKRIMEEAEWVLLPKALEMLCNGEFE